MKLAGDFVRSNELQEGDFIVIYSDVKGRYVMFITSLKTLNFLTMSHNSSAS